MSCSDAETQSLSPPQASSLNSDAFYDTNKVKITVIGDEGVGKTCLLMSFRPTNSSLIPSVFDGIMIERNISINSTDTLMQITLCDTHSTANDLPLRIKSYKNCDIICICFDISDLNSLHNISSQWIPEVQQYARNSSLMLIGLKSDVRSMTSSSNKSDDVESP